ncbi:MAG: phosphotransacetylase family protein [Nitrospirae bacterium]|nr:phosphotransacetylase family protein [Nitrospirota bacterium]MCL5238102.1 phosphotransacetylase family protein [Nitrospirota bacterium]
MVPIFIMSSRDYTGKTFLAIGLGIELMERGYKVGYIKPIGKRPVKKGKGIYDEDAVFMKEALSLADPLDIISPFVLSYEMQQLLLEGRIRDAKQRILDAFGSLGDKDFVIVGGAGDFFEGAALDINALSLIHEMNGNALIIEAWRGDVSLDTLLGSARLLGERYAGGVFNKVPANSLEHVKGSVKPFLENKAIRIFGVFQKDSLLESMAVRQLIEILNGKVLCCEDRLDEFVENFSIGAMDVDNALKYFRRTPNKAVITGAHRSDIQLVAMETSTKCIILTGGMYTNDVVLGRAQAKGIPIISVPEDTFTAIDRIESNIGKTRIREEGKINRAKKMIGAEFDMERFLKTVTGNK